MKDSKKESAENNYFSLIELIQPALKPFFQFNGKIDLSENDPTSEISDTLARILDCEIVINEEANDPYFCADAVLAKQIIVEDHKLIRFWGIVYWLDTPKDYEINKSGLDPFYCEFTIENEGIVINKMYCGDYDKTNLNKIWWFDVGLNWIFKFEKQTNIQ